MSWFRKAVAPSEPPASDWDQHRSYRPMDVVRTEDGNLIPPHDPSWDDATVLRWHMGVLKADTGFEVAAYQPSSGRGDTVDWKAFGLVAPKGRSGLASVRADDFWLFAVGVRWGVEWAKVQTETES